MERSCREILDNKKDARAKGGTTMGGGGIKRNTGVWGTNHLLLVVYVALNSPRFVLPKSALCLHPHFLCMPKQLLPILGSNPLRSFKGSARLNVAQAQSRCFHASFSFNSSCSTLSLLDLPASGFGGAFPSCSVNELQLLCSLSFTAKVSFSCLQPPRLCSTNRG